MDQGSNVQDENLVNEQVTQVLADSGVGAVVPEPTTVAGIADTVVATAPAIADETPAALTTPEEGTEETAPSATPLVSAPETEVPVPAPAVTDNETPSVSAPAPDLSTVSMGSGDDDELMDVKQKALEQLSPLVSHLDLPPEQKFDTYMEIIRASDDKSLIQPAFDVAQEIEDEDKKAQALLDVVNEVNYLTQEHDHEAS
jgi:hypothetical protein